VYTPTIWLHSTGAGRVDSEVRREVSRTIRREDRVLLEGIPTGRVSREVKKESRGMIEVVPKEN
jgi:hypothetical protein